MTAAPSATARRAADTSTYGRPGSAVGLSPSVEPRKRVSIHSDFDPYRNGVNLV